MLNIAVKRENIYKSVVSPTTYLKELGVEGPDTIVLVYSKDDSIKKELIPPTSPEPIKAELNDSLELTGCPLEVDLKGDESALSSGRQYHLCLWTDEEQTQYPLDIKKARQFINEQLKQKKCEIPYYAICDGDNTEHSVLLGAQQTNRLTMSTKANILGYIHVSQILSMEEMIENHKENTMSRDCEIKYETKFRYYLYGDFIQPTKYTNDLEIYGSVSIETKSSSKCSYNTGNNLSNINNMKLQVICGHPLSQVHFLWEDLCLLQTHLNILKNSEQFTNPDTVLSHDPCSLEKISQKLSAAIETNFLQNELSFSLTTIRTENLLDKIWRILKGCKYLSDLRDSFHFLFEELTDSAANVKVPVEDKTSIATIVRGLLKGDISVPTVTYSQALQFLFELGAEKLKTDYQVIVKNYCYKSETAVESIWSKFQSKVSLQKNHRKTRITVLTNPDVEILKYDEYKLAYLTQMHTAIEFISLISTEARLPEELFNNICKKLYETYITQELIGSDLSQLQDDPLCKFEMILYVLENKILQNVIPSTWSVKMVSLDEGMEVTTVYHLSHKPIFPLTVYNNYGSASATDHFYVSKLETYKKNL